MTLFAALSCALLLGAPAAASSQPSPAPLQPAQFQPAQPPDAPQLFSSSQPDESALPAADLATNDLPEAPAPEARARFLHPPLAVASHTRPFSTFAVAATLGFGGIGVDVATPLNTRINLRAGASFFNYTTSFTVDTVPIDGTLHLRNLHASVDWFLFNNSFHISPGLTLYNQTNYNALILVPANQVITLNDQDYTSDPADPIHGTAFLNFGNKFAPRLTMGWGNMIPHRDKNWTFPFEFGVDFRHAPTAVFQLSGSSCDSGGNCGPIQQDPDTQANILEQQTEITNDIAPLRFFPILSIGVSYKFGH